MSSFEVEELLKAECLEWMLSKNIHCLQLVLLNLSKSHVVKCWACHCHCQLPTSFPRVYSHTQTPITCVVYKKWADKKQDKTTNSHWEGITNITTNHLCKHKKAFPLVSVVRFSVSLGNKLFHAWAQQITMQMYDRAGWLFAHRLTRTNAIWRFCPILLHLESQGQMGVV